MKESQNDQARALFERALAIRPEYAFAHAQLGALDLSENEVQPAMRHFARTLELDPEHPGAARIRSLLEAYEAAPPDAGAAAASP
jgi:lipoprotein NlpI